MLILSNPIFALNVRKSPKFPRLIENHVSLYVNVSWWFENRHTKSYWNFRL